jgi:hypothetical protein
MTARLNWAAFLLGAAVIAWVGAGYIRHHPLAFAVTLLIGLTFVVGALELRRFRQATTGLAAALATVPAELPRLADWLDAQVPASLRQAVRLRVEGERVALPGPALTPYLVGLLVLLGMLGTFLGLVVTLDGAVRALETTTDLATIRSALSAPVKGLGLAFGTSVAGVAGSAMLGLMSTLARRERSEAGQRLDAQAAGPLRRFSATAVREATLAVLQQQGELLQRQTEALQQQGEAVQRQAEALPVLATRLHAEMLTQVEGRMEARMQALASQLGEQHQALVQGLRGGQDRFHDDARRAYGALAESVGASLRDGLAAGARAAGEAIQPLAEATLATIARDTSRLQAELLASTRALQAEVAGGAQALYTRVADGTTAVHARLVDQAETVRSRLADQAEAVHGRITGAAQQQLAETADRFAAQSAGLLAGLQQAQAALRDELAQRDQARQQAMADGLASLAHTLETRWREAGEQTLAQQQQLCTLLATSAQEIHARADAQTQAAVAEVGRLLQAAGDAPRAAAEAIGELRQALSTSLRQDNAALAERQRLLDTLAMLLDAIEQSASRQRGAVDALVASAEALLERTGAQAGQQLADGAERLDAVAAQVTGGAAEVASLGEAFGVAVERFTAATQQLGAGLQRIEQALAASMARSDEQLAYYVAQAREVIDLSLMSQQRLVGELQQHQRAVRGRRGRTGLRPRVPAHPWTPWTPPTAPTPARPPGRCSAT